MDEFYLPYQFIPVTGKIDKRKTPTRGFTDSREHARHDLWQRGRHTGRLICRLETLAPLCVGNRHDDSRPNKPTEIRHYCVDGQPAIPGSSLRGCIGSLMETLSQSSLRVLDSAFHDAFKAIDPDLLPWNDEREELTPAEQILGIAEDLGNGEIGHSARNLASRISFSDARFAPDAPALSLERKVLKVLGSPKPTEVPHGHKADRPSTYFYDARPKAGEATPIDKNQANERLHEDPPPHPAGRKIYLRHDHVDAEDGTGRADGQNVAAELIPEGATLWFHLDFENLDDAELTLLRHALTPSKYFCHQLGVGKPLGLGKCRISIAGLFLREPEQAYGPEASLTRKYHAWHTPEGDPSPGWHAFEADYAEEAEILADAEAGLDAFPGDDPALIDHDTRVILLQTGDMSTQAMRQGVPIRWREGHKGEKPAHLEPLRAGYSLPAFGQKARQTRAIPRLHSDNGPLSMDAKLDALIEQAGGDPLSRPLAEAICALEAREALFDTLMRRLGEDRFRIGNKANRIYRKHNLVIPPSNE
jgi:hypothetical protein